jgi:hypothetical protein
MIGLCAAGPGAVAVGRDGAMEIARQVGSECAAVVTPGVATLRWHAMQLGSTCSCYLSRLRRDVLL